MKINVIGGEIERTEIDEYIKYAYAKHNGRQIKQIDIIIDGEFAELKIHFKDTDFQRAYRSADYLVNDISKMNDAKQSEFAEKEKNIV